MIGSLCPVSLLTLINLTQHYIERKLALRRLTGRDRELFGQFNIISILVLYLQLFVLISFLLGTITTLPIKPSMQVHLGCRSLS